MRKKRLIQILALNICGGGARKRAEYLKSHHVFGYIGDNVRYQPRVIPLYPELIKLHDNVFLARNVHFETHDMISTVLNGMNVSDIRFPEHVGCIEIMENCFIGSDVTVLYGVRIGANTIVGSGSLVTKDLEGNSVYAGVPAQRIGSIENLIAKRADTEAYSWTTHNQAITKEEIERAWKLFDEKHNS